MLAVVVLLVMVERAARRGQRFGTTAQRTAPPARRPLRGWAGGVALAAGLIPVLIGFVFPALHLVNQAWIRLDFAGFSARLIGEALNTVGISAVATVIVIVLGVAVAYAARVEDGRLGQGLLRVASLGYALPGTVVALGLLAPLAGLDNFVDGAMRDSFGISTGLLLSGTVAALAYAYAVRFLAISAGGVDAGLAKVPRRLDYSARTLGRDRDRRASAGSTCRSSGRRSGRRRSSSSSTA